MRVFRQTALATVSALAMATPAAADDDLRAEALDMFSPVPSTIPAMTDNPITPAKIDLGKALFFDPKDVRLGGLLLQLLPQPRHRRG